jgi:hypothetical protein
MRIGRHFHLTYCSNIHPGETWDEVRRNLESALPTLRRQLHVDAAQPFGVGLRLSAQAAETLEQPQHLRAFREFLDRGTYYVFTINGFPYGAFHRQRVKEAVYLPDWRDEARVEYSNRLARVLAALLPDGVEGSVSTVPGAFRPEVRSRDDLVLITRHLVAHVSALKSIGEQTGRTIWLALEPEPRCHLETVADTVAFFEQYAFDEAIVADAARGLGVNVTSDDVRRHVGVCFDACHMAVEFEDVKAAIATLRNAGIRICKVQVSSALRLRFRGGDGQPAATLGPFANDVYLHQVVERRADGLTHYTDLPDALAAEAGADGAEKEWRVHFHVPIFLDRMHGFETTQGYLEDLLRLLRDDPVCPYLEVETYTWDVLPAEYRTVDTCTAIARELRWVIDRLER